MLGGNGDHDVMVITIMEMKMMTEMKMEMKAAAPGTLAGATRAVTEAAYC